MFFTDEAMNGVKLIDLGSAEDLSKPEIRKMHIDDHYKRTQHVNFVGTSQFMAPECVHNQPTTKASDVWSMGCILYQLYVGLPPFRGASDYLIFKLSLEAEFLKLEDYEEAIMPAEAKEFIKSMVKKEPKERATIEEVLQSSYFDGVRDLKKNPCYDDGHARMKEMT